MKKYNKKYVYYVIFRNLIYCIFLFGLWAFTYITKTEQTEDTIILTIAPIALGSLFIISTIYYILYYNMTTYEIGDKELILKKGVIFKKTTMLSYDKIHAVDKKQGLIQKLFGIASLSLDSGATTKASLAEIIIYENSYVIDNLSKEIDDRRYNRYDAASQIKAESVQTEECYRYETKGKFLYSLILSSFFFIVAALYTVIAFIILSILKEKSLVAYYVSLALLAAAVMTYLVSLITSLFMYYDFSVTKNDQEINISYGLFTRVNNKLAYKRIHGVIVSQGLLQRIFGFASIKLAVVGYGLSSNENQQQANITSHLIPFCRKRDVAKYLEMLLPEYLYKEKEVKSTNYKYHYLATVIVTTIIYALVLILSLGLIFVNKDAYLVIFGLNSLLYILMILLTLLISFLQYKNAGLTIDSNKVTLYTGSLIYNTFIIKKEYLTSIEKKDTYFRRKRHLTTYVVHYFANALSNTVNVPIVSDNYYEELNNLIDK